MVEYISVAITKILRPLIRWLISLDILFPDLNRLTKCLYVEAAIDILGEDNKHTISQIALMTGLHRKEIKDILQNHEKWKLRKKASPIKARLFSHWLSTEFATNVDGRPVPLPEKGQHSFETIAKMVSKDIAPGSMLKNGLRENYIKRLNSNLLLLNLEAFEGNESNQDDIYFLGANVADHISASLNNISGKKKKRFERAVYFDELDPKTIDKLRSVSSEKAQNLILEINKLAADLDSNCGDQVKNRFRFGFYFYDDVDG